MNSWHAVGPALVLVGAGQPAPTPRNLPIYALALLAQFAVVVEALAAAVSSTP